MSGGGQRRLGRDGHVAIVILAVSLALLAYLFANPSEGVSQHVSPNTLPTLLAAAIALLAALMLVGSARAAARVRDAAARGTAGHTGAAGTAGTSAAAQATPGRALPAAAEPLFGAGSLWLAAVTALYLALLPWLGYLVATGTYCAALAWLFGERRPVAIAVLAVVPVLCLYLFFVKFMIIPLPEARLFAHPSESWDVLQPVARFVAQLRLDG